MFFFFLITFCTRILADMLTTKQTYPSLTSLIRLMKASLLSLAFLLRFSPFNPSRRNCSRSKRQIKGKACTETEVTCLFWRFIWLQVAQYTAGDHLTSPRTTTHAQKQRSSFDVKPITVSGVRSSSTPAIWTSNRAETYTLVIHVESALPLSPKRSLIHYTRCPKTYESTGNNRCVQTNGDSLFYLRWARLNPRESAAFCPKRRWTVRRVKLQLIRKQLQRVSRCGSWSANYWTVTTRAAPSSLHDFHRQRWRGVDALMEHLCARFKRLIK